MIGVLNPFFSVNDSISRIAVEFINLDSFFYFYRGELLKGVDLTSCSSQNVVLNKPLLVILIIGSEPSKYVNMARCIYVLKRKRIAFPINMHLDRKDGNDILKHVPTQDG